MKRLIRSQFLHTFKCGETANFQPILTGGQFESPSI